LLYEALDANPPTFAHCPLMTHDDGNKLSKSVLKNQADNPFLIKNLS
jgi:Glutamyl- and glutaminyl-tRNA synthetases